MALTSEERNERRRLQRILADERYGPMLARLRGSREKQVLRLISEGLTKEAREAIVQHTENRLARRRELAAARRAQTVPRAPLFDAAKVTRAGKRLERAVGGFTGAFGKGPGTRAAWERMVWAHQYEPWVSESLDEILTLPMHHLAELAGAASHSDYSPYWYHTGM